MGELSVQSLKYDGSVTVASTHLRIRKENLTVNMGKLN